MNAAKECPRAETVASMIDGNLSSRERGILEDHLAACETCYRLLTESTEVWWRLDKALRGNDGE